MSIRLTRIVGRVVRRSALAVALVAALLGFSRSASALSMQPGDVAKLSYDFSSLGVPAGTTASTLSMQVFFASDGLFLQNTSFEFQFFNSDGTAIDPLQTFTSTAPFASGSVGGLGDHTFFGPINVSGFALLTSVDAKLDLTGAQIDGIFFPPFVTSLDANISSVSATPLPSSWGMMLLGLGLVGYLAYRRRDSGSVLAAA